VGRIEATGEAGRARRGCGPRKEGSRRPSAELAGLHETNPRVIRQQTKSYQPEGQKRSLGNGFQKITDSDHALQVTVRKELLEAVRGKRIPRKKARPSKRHKIYNA